MEEGQPLLGHVGDDDEESVDVVVVSSSHPFKNHKSWTQSPLIIATISIALFVGILMLWGLVDPSGPSSAGVLQEGSGDNITLTSTQMEHLKLLDEKLTRSAEQLESLVQGSINSLPRVEQMRFQRKLSGLIDDIKRWSSMDDFSKNAARKAIEAKLEEGKKVEEEIDHLTSNLAQVTAASEPNIAPSKPSTAIPAPITAPILTPSTIASLPNTVEPNPTVPTTSQHVTTTSIHDPTKPLDVATAPVHPHPATQRSAATPSTSEPPASQSRVIHVAHALRKPSGNDDDGDDDGGSVVGDDTGSVGGDDNTSVGGVEDEEAEMPRRSGGSDGMDAGMSDNTGNPTPDADSESEDEDSEQDDTSLDGGSGLRSHKHGGRSQTAPHAMGITSPANATSGIPRVIHMTWRDHNVSELGNEVARAVESWTALNPNHEVKVWDDCDIAEFVSNHFPEFVEEFMSLDRVEKTDLFRYLVLLRHGGVYTDVDTECLVPIDEWDHGQDSRVIIGLEASFPTFEFARSIGAPRQIQFCQWTIAACPGHEILEKVSHRILTFKGNHKRDGNDEVMETTGPGVWTDIVADYLKSFALQPQDVVKGRVVGDVRFLDIQGFGNTQGHSGAMRYDDTRNKGHALVHHMFLGSWRKPHTLLPPRRECPIPYDD